MACLREQMLAGNRVTLGALGSFGVELACEGAVTTEDYTTEQPAKGRLGLAGSPFTLLRRRGLGRARWWL